MILRTGRRNGRNLYLQLGERYGDDDPSVGMVDTAELARLMVNATNNALVAGDRPAVFELIMSARLTGALDDVAAVKEARGGNG